LPHSWRLDISRDHEESAYFDVLSALAPTPAPLVVRRLQTPGTDGQHQATVRLASPIGVAAHMAKQGTERRFFLFPELATLTWRTI
jgi:hypothetical protein